jgi:hypothetical protein
VLLAAPPKGSAIDVFINFGGGCCRRSRQHLPAAPPSMSSSTLVVATAGAPDSTSQGVRHRRLHPLQWWLLSELSGAPLRARHRRFHQLRWWPLPKLAIAPPPPKGPTINLLLNNDDGRCRNSRQHPRGQPSTFG